MNLIPIVAESYKLHGQGMAMTSTIIIEILYASTIIILCAIILSRTREAYRLSNHRGIGFFRDAFFFFALAYLFRIIPLLFRITDVHPRGLRIGLIMGFFLFSYASSMAIMSLARSLTWKKLENSVMDKSYLYHVLAIVFSSVVFIGMQKKMLLFITQAILIIIVFLITIQYHEQKRKISFTYITYPLLLLFWLMNLAIIAMPRIMNNNTLILYGLSFLVFIIIVYRVIISTRRR